MLQQVEPVKGRSRSTPNKSKDQSWHPYRVQLRDLDTIIRERYNDCIPNDPVGRALVDQAIARIRHLAKQNKVEDCGLREAEIFCLNYAPWADATEYSFQGYDPLSPLKSAELGAAIELTAQEKYEWGITHIQSFDIDPEIEAEKAQRKKELAAAREARRRHKRQIDKSRVERQAMMHVQELADQGFNNAAIAKVLNTLGLRTPSGRGMWREKMVTELIGADMTSEEKAAAKRKAAAERQRKARLQKLAMQEQQRLTAHANMMAEVTLRIMELKAKGASWRSIARTLTEEGAPTLSGKAEWSDKSVKSLAERAPCEKPVTQHVPR